MLDAELAGERVYPQVIGGAPLNVAVGIARLGGPVEFADALGDDPLADRIIELLDQAGVGTRGTIRRGRHAHSQRPTPPLPRYVAPGIAAGLTKRRRPISRSQMFGYPTSQDRNVT